MTAHHYLFLELFLTAKVDTAGFSAPQSDMTLESVLLQSHKKEFTIQTSACISNIQYHHAIFTTYNNLYVLCHSHNEVCMVKQQMYMSPHVSHFSVVNAIVGSVWQQPLQPHWAAVVLQVSTTGTV